MSLSQFVYHLGRGPSKSRNLTREEAGQAMALILDGKAEPEAIGALLMLMRYRGESAEEIAGFVDAIRARLTFWKPLNVALDWPSYAAGRSRGHPWFLLSAKLVANAGYPVLIHGWNSHQNQIASVREALKTLEIDCSNDPNETGGILQKAGIAYVPVEAMHNELLQLLKLRDVLGLRSPINTALRALNPTHACASVQGVFHPSYRALQQNSASLLCQKRLTVIKGGGGEFERNPGKDIELFRIESGKAFGEKISASCTEKRRLSSATSYPKDLLHLWTGTHADPFATAIVVATAALALETVDGSLSRNKAQALADDLWTKRLQKYVA